MLWLIITIIVCTYFIVKVVKDQSPEGQQKKALKEIDVVEGQIKYWCEHIMHREPDLIESQTLDDLRMDFTKMEDKYNSLKITERDSKKLLEFATDFKNYAEALFHLKMAWCIFTTDLSNEAIDRYGEKSKENTLIKQAVEKKFA